MGYIRAFVAVQLPPDVKRTLSGIRSRLQSDCCAPVKWVETEKLHLTLKFLGNIDEHMPIRIIAGLEEGLAAVRPFAVKVGSAGVFPNFRRPQVIWIGFEGETRRLIALQKSVDGALASLGFVPEKRAFQPHLTIGRVRDGATPAEREELGRFIGNLTGTRGGTVPVDAVHLVKSVLTSSGPIYTIIGSVSLS